MNILMFDIIWNWGPVNHLLITCFHKSFIKEKHFSKDLLTIKHLSCLFKSFFSRRFMWAYVVFFKVADVTITLIEGIFVIRMRLNIKIFNRNEYDKYQKTNHINSKFHTHKKKREIKLLISYCSKILSNFTLQPLWDKRLVLWTNCWHWMIIQNDAFLLENALFVTKLDTPMNNGPSK